jgi:hypothetical protein
MSYSDDWLKGLPFWKTKSGARLDLRFYISPDGHGNIHYKVEHTGEDANLPVNNPDYAIDILRSIWEHAQKHGVQDAPQAPDEQ